MKQVIKEYRWIWITILVVFIVSIVVSAYAVGIVNQNTAIAQVDKNIGNAERYILTDAQKSDLLQEEYKDDYTAKARMAAILLEQDEDYLNDDQILEELRVTINAERISVFDENGKLSTSTDPSAEEEELQEVFRSHVTDTVYTDVEMNLDAETPSIYAASVMPELHSIVQISFNTDTLVSLLNEADFSDFASEHSLYDAGMTIILDADTLEYISNSSNEELYTQLTADMFEKNKGKFEVEITEGEKALLRYDIDEDYIVAAVIPYAKMYHTRNVVVLWVVLEGILVAATGSLALRMYHLQKKKAERK